MKKELILICLLNVFFLLSCDKQVGEKGVVQNFVTGERLQGVIVKMSSSQGDKTDTTNAQGYFNVIKTLSCGIASCEDNYKIEFIKIGFDTLRINENYYSSEFVQFVNAENRDTLLIKLNPQN